MSGSTQTGVIRDLASTVDDHPTVDTLDALISVPTMMRDSDRATAMAHIAKCAVCGEKMAQFMSEYAEERASAVDPRMLPSRSIGPTIDPRTLPRRSTGPATVDLSTLIASVPTKSVLRWATVFFWDDERGISDYVSVEVTDIPLVGSAEYAVRKAAEDALVIRAYGENVLHERYGTLIPRGPKPGKDEAPAEGWVIDYHMKVAGWGL